MLANKFRLPAPVLPCHICRTHTSLFSNWENDWYTATHDGDSIVLTGANIAEQVIAWIEELHGVENASQ